MVIGEWSLQGSSVFIEEILEAKTLRMTLTGELSKKLSNATEISHTLSPAEGKWGDLMNFSAYLLSFYSLR